MLCHDTLANFYITQFILKNDYGYSLEEQGDMIPFERDMHLKFIMDRIKEKQGGVAPPELPIPTREEIEALRR